MPLIFARRANYKHFHSCLHRVRELSAFFTSDRHVTVQARRATPPPISREGNYTDLIVQRRSSTLPPILGGGGGHWSPEAYGEEVGTPPWCSEGPITLDVYLDGLSMKRTCYTTSIIYLTHDSILWIKTFYPVFIFLMKLILVLPVWLK